MNNDMQLRLDEEREAHKERLLQETMKRFQEQLKTITEEVLSDLNCDLLPHVYGDTESNISFRIDKIINNILAGKIERVDTANNLLMFKVEDGYDFHTYVSLGAYSDLIEPIWKEFGKDIENIRIKQLEEEVLELKSRLHLAYCR